MDFKYRLDFFCFSDDTDYKDFTDYYYFSRNIVFRYQKQWIIPAIFKN
jgi:hypothetical protein